MSAALAAEGVASGPAGALVRVRVTPGAQADRVEGWAADAAGRTHLKVRVRAKAEDGKANLAVAAVLAQALGRPRSAVTLISGATGRVKVLGVEGMSAAAASAALARVGAGP